MPFIEIKIPNFSTSDLQKRLNVALQRRGRRNENLLLRTTQYFETVRPVFQSEIERTADGWDVITQPLDDESGQIWTYLNEGTDVRFATMEGDFVAGTTPGTFETQPSVGGVQFVNVEIPQEGIEPRGWTELLATQEQPRFAGEMKDMLDGWLNKWSSITGRISRIISG